MGNEDTAMGYGIISQNFMIQFHSIPYIYIYHISHKFWYIIPLYPIYNYIIDGIYWDYTSLWRLLLCPFLQSRSDRSPPRTAQRPLRSGRCAGHSDPCGLRSLGFPDSRAGPRRSASWSERKLRCLDDFGWKMEDTVLKSWFFIMI